MPPVRVWGIVLEQQRRWRSNLPCRAGHLTRSRLTVIDNVKPEDDDTWAQGLAAVRRYVSVRGSAARIPGQARAHGVAVGAWVNQQRDDYWAGRLAPQRVSQLERLPGWSWAGVAQQKWERALAALARYAEQHGTAAVPVGTVLGEIRIGEWVAAQRAGHEAGTLAPVNAAKLEALPGWRWRVTENRWEQGLAAARAAVIEQGTVDLPAEAEVDGFKLGYWIQWCRAEHRAGALSPEHVALVESLPGWSWSTSTERWERGLAALRKFVAVHGSASPPQHAVVDGFPIGMWVHSRRREHRTGSLRPQRAATLEAFPGWQWDVRHSRWEEGYGHLMHYVSHSGHSQPPVDAVEDGFQVGRWVRAQRRAHSAGRLPPEWIAQLESLPQWTWTLR